MKTTLIALTLLLASSAAATAQQPVADKAAQAQPSGKKETPRNCISDTGSHLRHRPGECVNEPGRVYTREDLDRSGEINTAEALRKLDPAFR